MASPMIDLPDHMLIPVNAAGEGPADPEEAVTEVCWCGIPECDGYGNLDGNPDDPIPYSVVATW